MRPLIVLSFLFAVLAVGSPAAAQEPAPTTTIAGGGLTNPITLSAIDHEGFVRRLDLPPLLDGTPVVTGPAFTVTSPYWDEAVRAGAEDEATVDSAATYYSESGLVMTKQGNEEVWTAVDSKQRMILNRYIRTASVLPRAPSAFEVMRAASATETIGITIGTIELTPEQRLQFWELSRNVAPDVFPTPITRGPLVLDPQNQSVSWIIFSLPEGRSVQMLYSAVTGTLSELNEAYESGISVVVPQNWLVPVLGEGARPGPTFALQPLDVPQDDGAGSPIWWLIAIGGGLGALAAAVFMQRRFSGQPGSS